MLAWHISTNSPAASAGIRAGDKILAINDLPIHDSIDVTKRLWRIGLWSQAHYRIERGGKQFEALLVTQPAERPSSIENYLSESSGLLYLFIGLFIFARRWNATRAVHFYIFCLVSAVLYSFQYTGKLSTFDWEIYWPAFVARSLQPSRCCFHFALVFPERRTHRQMAAWSPPSAASMPCLEFSLVLRLLGGAWQTVGICAID